MATRIHDTAWDNSPGVVLSREQAAQLAYNAGARGEDLAFLTGIPQGESAYRPGTHRTDTRNNEAASGDFGMWQINWSAWGQQLINAGIIRSHTDLYDPQTNAKAAVFVLQHQGRNAWMSFDGSMSGNQRINWDAARASVQSAASKGMLGQDFQSGSTATAGGAPAGGAAGTAAGPGFLPPDARLVVNTSSAAGDVWAFFKVAPGLSVRFRVTDRSMIGGRPVQRLSPAQIKSQYGTAVNAGDSEELKGVSTQFGTFKVAWNSILDTVLPKGNPARNDPQVLRVLAEYAGRPDMDRAELQNKLQGTKWFQSRTAAELEWNDLSQAERDKRLGETLALMKQQFQTLVGNAPSGWHQNLPDVVAVASGKMSFNEWIETKAKPAAWKNPESPLMRQGREEREAQRQRGVDIENTVARVRNELERYGLRWDAKTLMWHAKALVEKRISDDDLVQKLERNAQALYPGLGPLNGSDVVTLAAPWLETYERVLERTGSVFTPEIQRALARGESVWDMEVALTKTPKWQTTRNADERVHAFVGQLEESFGF